jgi:integrase
VRIDGRVVAEVVKRLFRDAGSAESEVEEDRRPQPAPGVRDVGRYGRGDHRIGAHSLRRGFVTSAYMAGATTAQIMDVTGHRDPKSLRRFTRRELLHDPVLPKLFEP